LLFLPSISLRDLLGTLELLGVPAVDSETRNARQKRKLSNTHAKKVSASCLSMSSSRDLDEAERYAAAALFTLALHIIQVGRQF